MSNPIVSVLMPVYNGERYLREAVASVLSQDFGDFELLITDDASTDGTADLLAALASDDRRITVLRNPRNAGAAAALEAMTQRAGGEFVARMDADDVSLPGRFSVQVTRFRRDPKLGVLGTWVRSISSDGQPFEEQRFPDDGPWIKRELEKGRNVTCDGTLMFRKILLAQLQAPVWRFRYGQTFDLLLRLMDRTQFGLVDDVLYLWRWHAAGLRAAAMQQIREQTDRVILELHALRSRNLPEFDWRAKEQEILNSAKSDAGLPQSWEDYRRGRTALASGDARAARQSLRAASANPKIRRKALFLFCLACLPAGCGAFAAGAIDRMAGLWDPHAKYIRRMDKRG